MSNNAPIFLAAQRGRQRAAGPRGRLHDPQERGDFWTGSDLRALNRRRRHKTSSHLPTWTRNGCAGLPTRERIPHLPPFHRCAHEQRRLRRRREFGRERSGYCFLKFIPFQGRKAVLKRGIVRQKWELAHSTITQGAELGKGAFGVVKRGIFKDPFSKNSVQVAIKEVSQTSTKAQVEWDDDLASLIPTIFPTDQGVHEWSEDHAPVRPQKYHQVLRRSSWTRTADGPHGIGVRRLSRQLPEGDQTKSAQQTLHVLWRRRGIGPHSLQGHLALWHRGQELSLLAKHGEFLSTKRVKNMF